MQLIATKTGILSSLQEKGKFVIFFFVRPFWYNTDNTCLLFEVRLNLRQVKQPCLF